MKTREELFTKLKQELVVHEAIEEEIFYPALKEHPKTKEIALEGYEEHHVVDTVMAEIEGAARTTTRQWGAKFTVMKENLEHHIEEEEGEMFKQAHQVFDEDELARARRVHDGAQGRVDAAAVLGRVTRIRGVPVRAWLRLPGRGPYRSHNPLQGRSEVGERLDSIEERAPQRDDREGLSAHPRGFSSLATSAGVPSRLATTAKRSFS